MTAHPSHPLTEFPYLPAEITNPGQGINKCVGTGTGDRAVGFLGAEIIADGPVDSPLPVTGHCARCDSSTIRYCPAGSPLCDRCREGGARDLLRPPRTPNRPEAHPKSPVTHWPGFRMSHSLCYLLIN